MSQYQLKMEKLAETYEAILYKRLELENILKGKHEYNLKYHEIKAREVKEEVKRIEIYEKKANVRNQAIIDELDQITLNADKMMFSESSAGRLAVEKRRFMNFLSITYPKWKEQILGMKNEQARKYDDMKVRMMKERHKQEMAGDLEERMNNKLYEAKHDLYQTSYELSRNPSQTQHSYSHSQLDNTATAPMRESESNLQTTGKSNISPFRPQERLASEFLHEHSEQSYRRGSPRDAESVQKATYFPHSQNTSLTGLSSEYHKTDKPGKEIPFLFQGGEVQRGIREVVHPMIQPSKGESKSISNQRKGGGTQFTIEERTEDPTDDMDAQGDNQHKTNELLQEVGDAPYSTHPQFVVQEEIEDDENSSVQDEYKEDSADLETIYLSSLSNAVNQLHSDILPPLCTYIEDNLHSYTGTDYLYKDIQIEIDGEWKSGVLETISHKGRVSEGTQLSLVAGIIFDVLEISQEMKAESKVNQAIFKLSKLEISKLSQYIGQNTYPLFMKIKVHMDKCIEKGKTTPDIAANLMTSALLDETSPKNYEIKLRSLLKEMFSRKYKGGKETMSKQKTTPGKASPRQPTHQKTTK